jgi:hypothetical protein
MSYFHFEPNISTIGSKKNVISETRNQSAHCVLTMRYLSKVSLEKPSHVVNVAVLLLMVKMKPVVKAGNIAILGLADQNMFVATAEKKN